MLSIEPHMFSIIKNTCPATAAVSQLITNLLNYSPETKIPDHPLVMGRRYEQSTV